MWPRHISYWVNFMTQNRKCDAVTFLIGSTLLFGWWGWVVCHKCCSCGVNRIPFFWMCTSIALLSVTYIFPGCVFGKICDTRSGEITASICVRYMSEACSVTCRIGSGCPSARRIWSSAFEESCRKADPVRLAIEWRIRYVGKWPTESAGKEEVSMRENTSYALAEECSIASGCPFSLS
jgi:hypothetical protein